MILRNHSTIYFFEVVLIYSNLSLHYGRLGMHFALRLIGQKLVIVKI